MNRDFKGIWIPREIWLHVGLSLQAKTLWAEIYSLHCREVGGCYASDEYLMNFLGLKLSRLHEVMKELRDANLIEKVSFNGRNRVIKALVPEVDYEKESNESDDGGRQPSGKPEPSFPENRNPPFRKTGIPPVYIEKSKDIRNKEEKPPNPQRGNSAIAEDISSFTLSKMKEINPLCRGPNSFAAWNKTWDKLLKENISADRIKAALECAFSDDFWQEPMMTNPHQKLEKNFNTFEAKLKQKPNASRTGSDQAQLNKQKVMARFKDDQIIKHYRVELRSNSIMFVPTVGQSASHEIKYIENGFDDQLDNVLRKLGIKP